MSGQILIHEGILVAGSSAPAIRMSTPDDLAAESSALLFALSGRDPGEYVNDAFRSRKGGAPFSLFPVNAENFAVKELGGRLAIVSPGTTSARTLVSPAQQFRGGFTAVVAVYVAAESIASGADTNIISILDEGSSKTRIFNPIRYGGGGTFRFNSFSGTAVPAGAPGWYIVVSDFAPLAPASSPSATYRLGVNAIPSNPITTSSIDLPSVYQNPSLAVGYHTGSNGLRDCGVGDLYFHNESLCSSQSGLAYLGELIATLKAQYGIA
ncbi:hypothetical protein [Bordetella trematum]|uniref:hypothetical protein n=1 Tax=Bordetella trematum TaxID=123899 RepID=UPI003AF3EB01